MNHLLQEKCRHYNQAKLCIINNNKGGHFNATALLSQDSEFLRVSQKPYFEFTRLDVVFEKVYPIFPITNE